MKRLGAVHKRLRSQGGEVLQGSTTLDRKRIHANPSPKSQ